MNRIKKIIWIICSSAHLFIGSSAFALTVDTPLKDAGQEARAKALFHEIRCVVCQSEAIADSPAEVAADMRCMIRERITAGDSDDTLRGYLTKRYGDAILMQPPLKPRTSLLWFGPLLLLAIGVLLAKKYFRKMP